MVTGFKYVTLVMNYGALQKSGPFLTVQEGNKVAGSVKRKTDITTGQNNFNQLTINIMETK